MNLLPSWLYAPQTLFAREARGHSFLARIVKAKRHAFGATPYHCAPASGALVKPHTAGAGGVSGVLKLSNFSQIADPIVEPVPVYVVNNVTCLSASYQPMH